MAQTESKPEEIVYEWEAVSPERMRALAKATRSDFARVTPPTFPTIYRWGEFEWLKRLGLDLRNLLHTEQEYEYLAPLVVGERPRITTVLKQQRVKAGMTFLVLESGIECGGRLAVRVISHFVIRNAGEGTK